MASYCRESWTTASGMRHFLSQTLFKYHTQNHRIILGWKTPPRSSPTIDQSPLTLLLTEEPRCSAGMTERLVLNNLENKWGRKKKSLKETTFSGGIFQNAFSLWFSPSWSARVCTSCAAKAAPMQKQTEPLLLLFSKELRGDLTATHARQTTHKFCSHLHRHNSTVFRDYESCTSVAGKEKSSLSCSLNWKNSLSSALTSLLQNTTTARARLCSKLWDSSGLDLSFSMTLHPTHLMPQGRININLAFDQLILSVPRSVFLTLLSLWAVWTLQSREGEILSQAELWYVHQPPGPGSRENWGSLGVSGDLFLCYGNTPVYSRGGSRVPGLRSDPGYVPRYPHTPEPSTCSRMHWIWNHFFFNFLKSAVDLKWKRTVFLCSL